MPSEKKDIPDFLWGQLVFMVRNYGEDAIVSAIKQIAGEEKAKHD